MPTSVLVLTTVSATEQMPSLQSVGRDDAWDNSDIKAGKAWCSSVKREAERHMHSFYALFSSLRVEPQLVGEE